MTLEIKFGLFPIDIKVHVFYTSHNTFVCLFVFLQVVSPKHLMNLLLSNFKPVVALQPNTVCLSLPWSECIATAGGAEGHRLNLTVSELVRGQQTVEAE